MNPNSKYKDRVRYLLAFGELSSHHLGLVTEYGVLSRIEHVEDVVLARFGEDPDNYKYETAFAHEPIVFHERNEL